MGGYNAGEVASGMAAEFLMTHLDADLGEWRRELKKRGRGALHALLRARIDGANTAIIAAADRHSKYYGMGTTLVMALFFDDVLTTVHLGDSRAYRLRNSTLTLLTRDHSLLQDQLDAGVLSPAEARISTNKNFVTRALGVDASVDAEITDYEIEDGDLYLLCTDGLSNMVSDDEIRAILLSDAAAGDGNLAAVANELIDTANEHGGRDNVSVILVRVTSPGVVGASRSGGVGAVAARGGGGLLDRLVKLRK